MYPWHKTLSSLEARTNLRVDALGLVTILGAENVNTSVGRLVPSRYLDYLPLLGAFVFASNDFTSKRPGFQLANLTSDITTGEVAGWFSRWLSSQEFHQIHHKLVWKVADTEAAHQGRGGGRFWAAWPIGIALNGILLALSVLADDWWGFANVVSMILSIVVRAILVQQNRAGIDNAIRQLTNGPGEDAKTIIVCDDSKVITMSVPVNLISVIFTRNPEPPRPELYRLVRWVGWIAFAVHVISIGMASLVTQIVTVVLMIVSTVLTIFKIGCDDWRMIERVSEVTKRQDLASEPAVTCRVSSLLSVSVSEYPLEYDMIANVGVHEPLGPQKQYIKSYSITVPQVESPGVEENTFDVRCAQRSNDVEMGTGSNKVEESWPQMENRSGHGTKRRQDLYVWLNMSEEEEESMQRWNLAPRMTERNKKWWALYRTKQEWFRARFPGAGLP
ncbi:hypothetical protein F5Y17DRAFT_311417 [Xylariaceae sp. FL0594]|nr:hypothetical protein F5Y17DRAFT_311417 [Xylariaceae sp. FL0594]